ncbi:Cell division protein ZipA [Pseudoalteromonas holothuriae]|uniref:Cell division protein ZipA n=1 Tax=Pseudoalteromonas holothuriae TaxID=2963714 RepID=A0A9W4QRJ0_9GAMM|nr:MULTISPECIES: cell division protein ZipA [unclassified Pseudoalteromonas]CAH9049933.1 Cell division protein ZipA [Pseudoalteromonas sp. CIP111854]CAH9052016.1 Cell division protein ZipA [Pseudoalteromonas sp. CIP111951]
MATELRWALIVISALVIGGLLIHGLWSVRKKNSDEQPQPRVQPDSHKSKPNDEHGTATLDDEPDIGELSFAATDDEPHHDTSDSVELAEHDETGDDLSASKVDDANSDVPQAQEFIILHIEMPQGLTMAGSRLLPSVLSLGFKYSDEGFFNRHVEPSGNGPVLFRLVNMFNPGTFDIDNMEQFSTAGVSLFMTLPCDGDGLAAFNMLHGAAKKLADEFGATVLDSHREPLSVSTVRAYVEKVREFS